MGDRAIGYVRVSRVAGREGDSFLSPDQQRQSIERVSQREGLELVDVVEELDASGGDNERPLWNRALERVERGEARALVVWNFSRFSRSAADAEIALRRIEAAGGRLLSESESFDTSTPEGRFARRTLFSMAEMERERSAATFRRAGASAIERGIHFASRVPFGYARDPETRKLVPDENAPTVVELFERRAKRQGWFALARWLVERGASPKTNPAAVRWMVRNRAYLGEARSGEFVNRKAHPAIVTRLLFDRANAVHGRAPKKDGSITRHLLLGGLVFCAGCGHRLTATGGSGPKGEDGVRRKVPTYGCTYAHCKAKASVRGADLDPYVVNALFAMLRLVGTTGFREPGATPFEVDEARAAVEAAEYDRSKLVENRELRRLLSADEYNAELVALAEAVEEAQIALELAEAEPEAPLQDVRGLWDEWTDETRREWLREVVERVEVTSARKRRNVPIYERVRVTFLGLGELQPTEADIEERRRRLKGFPGVKKKG